MRFLACSALTALALALTSGCAVRSDRQQSGFNEFGDRRESYSTQVSFVSQETADLDKAYALARAGEFLDAIKLLETVRARPGLEPELHQDVLLALGQMHGAWRNAHKDYDKGLAALRDLLARYPDTAHRERANEMMAAYEKAQEQQ
ncbi:MAG: hypothetical protein GWN29_14125 [Gammaproteobacteria bacterium]|nr:hypothetical protein [Gammaproteobacteria bacterium]